MFRYVWSLALIFVFPSLLWAFPEELPQPPAKHLTDGGCDAQGHLWVCTENAGLFRLQNLPGAHWENMSAVPGFPQTLNTTAVACDALGRVWIGTDRFGVLVYDGKIFKSYGRDSVLNGGRIYDIAVRMKDNLVAVAHESGVTLYDSEKACWYDLNSLNLLPFDAVTTLAFESNGALICGTESQGVYRFSKATKNEKAKVIRAPYYFDNDKRFRFPLTINGKGLVSNFCTQISVGTQGQIAIGSPHGISISTNGHTFFYWQGHHLLMKIKGILNPKNLEKIIQKFKPDESGLNEDYVSALHYRGEQLWIGLRSKGIEVRDAANFKNKILFSRMPSIKSPVRAFVTLSDGRLLAATYGDGLIPLLPENKEFASLVKTLSQVSFPCKKRMLDSEFLSILNHLQSVKKKSGPSACLIRNDWETRGNWCYHYGATYYMLCAVNAPWSNQEGCDDKTLTDFQAKGAVGIKKDALRHWVHWVNKPDNINVLFNRFTACRTEAEWDDHGEEYPRSFDGPNIWIDLHVPDDNPYIAAFYFYNPNGREGANGERDYIFEIYVAAPDESFETTAKRDPLCIGRIYDFSLGGVYKTFCLQGTDHYRIRILRNGSLNTILNGIFLQRFVEKNDYECSNPVFVYNEKRFNCTPLAPCYLDLPINELTDTMKILYKARLNGANNPQILAFFNQIELEFYREMMAQPDSFPQKAGFLKRLGVDAKFWNSEKCKAFETIMATLWADNQERFHSSRSKEWFPHSPNVLPLSREELIKMDQLGINWKLYLKSSKESPVIPFEDLRSHLRNQPDVP